MKNPVTQFSLLIIAFVSLTFLMGYTKPSAEEPKDYVIVLDRTHTGLEKQVNQKLSEGWHLQGGVGVYGQDHYQAMAK